MNHLDNDKLVRYSCACQLASLMQREKKEHIKELMLACLHTVSHIVPLTSCTPTHLLLQQVN